MVALRTVGAMAKTSLLVVNMNTRSLALLFAVLLTVGCASTQPARDYGPSPNDVKAGAQVDSPVTWGGRIVNTQNLRDRTLIEVVALALDSDGRPDPQADPRGRFIVERGGFLEPHEYAPDPA